MKRFFPTALATFCAISGMAQTITVDDIKYIVNEGTNTVYVDGFTSGTRAPESVVIPSTIEDEGETYTVTGLGIAAFYGSRIKSLTLPSTITFMGDHCLEGTDLTEFTVPSGVSELPKSAFASCYSLTHVDLPDGLTSIGSSAFSDCSALEYIQIPESVTFFGAAAFSGCSSMEYVNYMGTLITWFAIDFQSPHANPLYSGHVWKVKGQTPTAISVMPRVGAVKANAFAGCTSLISIEVMDGITSIGKNAFSGCTGLNSITLYSDIETIDEWAFQNCTSLQKVYVLSLPEFLNIDFGGWNANPLSNGGALYVAENGRFGNPTKDLVIPSEISILKPYALNGCSSIETATLHDGVTVIGEAAFKECTNLKEIALSSGLEEIGYEAFSSCASLEKIEMGENVTSIGDRAFLDCTALSELILSPSLTAIPGYMATGCSSLTTITIPDSVVSIGELAFQNNSSLAEVIFGEGIQTIGSQAFSSTPLTSIDIQTDQLSVIDALAFYDCMSLVNVTLGPGLTEVGSQAFYRCMALRNFTCMATQPAAATSDMCLGSTFNNATLYVPEASISSYASATGWSNFGTIEASPITGVNSIDTDNAEAIYYRPDGTQVSGELTKGLYIRVIGNKSEKVMI